MKMNKQTDAKLKDACDSISYEVMSLHHSLLRLTGNLDTLDKNCFLETYAIHLRCLAEFLKCKPKGEYIRAEDFLDETQIKTWRDFIKKYAEFFKIILDKSDVQLAHLSYGRGRESYKNNKKKWDFGFCRKIDECLLKWSSLVPRSRLSDDLINLINHLQKK